MWLRLSLSQRRARLSRSQAAPAAKMTASAVFILDMKGKVIISRNYRGDVPMNCVERFSGHVLEAEANDERPVWLEHGASPPHFPAAAAALLLSRHALSHRHNLHLHKVQQPVHYGGDAA